MKWNDLPVRTQQNQSLIDYDPQRHGKPLSEALSRGERVTIGKDGDRQIVFNPVSSSPDQQKETRG